MEITEFNFNAEKYLDKNPDIKVAIETGGYTFKTAWEHYQQFGKKEGRKVYPLYSEETIETGLVEKIETVPDKFTQKQEIEYPEGNTEPFEYYFLKTFIEKAGMIEPKRTYLPVQWTSLFAKYNFPRTKETLHPVLTELQHFINSLDTSKKYFTVYQYDFSLADIIDTSHLDLLVYASGNYTPGYYPIPLLSYPINAKQTNKFTKERDILYSFRGNEETHECRKKMIKQLQNKYVTSNIIDRSSYLSELQQSIFALCPRGVGHTSFRLTEAMANRAIPVYISDNFIEPFNIPFTEYGIKVHISDLDNLQTYMRTADIEKLQANGAKYYNEYFVYSSCFNAIIETLA